MTIRLKRDAMTGVIKNVNDPIILRGGHYDLFQQQGQGNYALLGANDNIFDVAYTTINEEPCSKRALPAGVYRDIWDGEPWTDFFQSCQQNGINLLRVFASDGTRLGPNNSFLDMSPFQIEQAPGQYKGKYKVRQAAENTGGDAYWNMNYFKRLASFVDQANARQICVMVTIFNSYDLSDDYTANVYGAWKGSFWNPDNTNDPAWGRDNLVPPAGAPDRQTSFIVPANNIHYVQYALIKRIVRSLRGRGNVIFEIMNEPRRATPQQLVDFYTNMIRWIREQFESAWNPMICINDFNFDGGQSEMEYWKQNYTSAYSLVDLLSYHGLSGYSAAAQVCNSGSETIALTDPDSLNRRFAAHRATHPGMGMIFSSDGASVQRLRHHNAEVEMNITDGQIDTNLNLNIPSPNPIPLRADLHDWATWCLGITKGTPGVAHFQNHSSYERSFEKIHTAATEVKLAA